jgi:hypothetical protein
VRPPRVERLLKMTRTELIIQLLKVAIGLAFGAYFVWWSLQVLDRLTPEYDARTAVAAVRLRQWRRPEHDDLDVIPSGLARRFASVGGVESSRKDRGDVEGDGWIVSKNRRRVGDIKLRSA